jgi:hypothetical protein
MRRLPLLLPVALMMAAVMALMAAPAFATIHPIAVPLEKGLSGEKSNAPADTPAQTQNPPGITGEDHEPGYTDPDPDKATEAQPLEAQLANSTTSDCNAWKGEVFPGLTFKDICLAESQQ